MKNVGKGLLVLLVTPLHKCEKVGADSLLPYDLLRYEFAPGRRTLNVTYQLLDPDTILRPCIIVGDADRRKWNMVSKRRPVLQTVRYWEIRYSTTDRGYGYGALDEGRGDKEAPQRPPALDDDMIQATYDGRRERALEDEEESYNIDKLLYTLFIYHYILTTYYYILHLQFTYHYIL
jgi:hypothetical protein